MKIVFVKLSEDQARNAFDCGVDSLNEFLKKNARQNQTKNLSVTTAIVEGDRKHKILGYHTLSISVTERNSFPEILSRKIPKYPVPVIRLARLAVDRAAQGSGLGKELLIDALLKALAVHEKIPIYAVVVDALDENAKRFYMKFGFVPFQNIPLSLFLPIESIILLFRNR